MLRLVSPVHGISRVVGRTIRVILASVGILGVSHPSFAQPEQRRIEIGVGAALIRFVDFDSSLQQLHEQFPQSISLHSWNDPGPQLRFTVNLSASIGIEAVGSVLPRFRSGGELPSRGGAKALGEAGVTGKRRWGNVTLLGTLRAGAASFSLAPAVSAGGAGSVLIVETGAGRTYPCFYAAGG